MNDTTTECQLFNWQSWDQLGIASFLFKDVALVVPIGKFEVDHRFAYAVVDYENSKLLLSEDLEGTMTHSFELKLTAVPSPTNEKTQQPPVVEEESKWVDIEENNDVTLDLDENAYGYSISRAMLNALGELHVYLLNDSGSEHKWLTVNVGCNSCDEEVIEEEIEFLKRTCELHASLNKRPTK